MDVNQKPTAISLAKFYGVSRETIRNYRDGYIEKQRLYNAMVEYLNAGLTAIKISDAIKELQELENRTCSNCNNFKIFNSKVVRDSCSILNVSDIGGCGDYFEPKKG